MKATGKIISVDLDFATHKPKVTLELNSQYDILTEEMNTLSSQEFISIELKKYSKKRSLNANAYCWTLIGKIAEEMQLTKEEVYAQYIKTKGIFRVVTIDSKAVDTFVRVWTEKGLGWLVEVHNNNIQGFKDVTAYYGTSSYNAKQMANFIDYIVDEAKELGIETLSRNEIELLKENWRK